MDNNDSGGAMIARDNDGSIIIPASIGQQIFAITSGVAGGLAGLVLATRLSNATTLKAQGVLLASLVTAVATFSVVYMIAEGNVEEGSGR